MVADIVSEKLFHDLNGNLSSGFATIHSPIYRSLGGIFYLNKPGVAAIARPRVNMQGLEGFLGGFDESLHFLDYLNDPIMLSDGAQLCKVAGQLCYMSFGPGRTSNAQSEKYFQNIKSSKHGSVLEHTAYSMLLYGISRSVTHELVRHRAGFGFSQVSQRYVSGRVLRFVERPEYCDDEQLHTLFLQRIERAADEYTTLTNRLSEMQQLGASIFTADMRTDLRKKVQQCARSVLPNETEAPIVVTANVRAWRHFIEMRASSHAEIEIRELAVRIFLCLFQMDPILFDDYALEKLPDGTYVVQTMFEKV